MTVIARKIFQNKAAAQLVWSEGLRLRPYLDSVGVWTIGVGHNLKKGISKDQANYILMTDIATVENNLDNHFPWWRDMDEPRQLVLIGMCFNLGITRLKRFKKTLKAMENGDYQTAADEMVDSKWYRQVGNRGKRLVKIMRTGKWIKPPESVWKKLCS